MTRLLSIIAPVLLLAVVSMGQVIGDCEHWNSDSVGSNTLKDYLNTSYHISGEHSIDAWRTGTCTYQCEPGQCNPGSQCIATIDVSDSPTLGETGLVSNYTHVLKSATAGSSASNNGPISSPASAGVNVAQCAFGTCNVSINITAPGVMTVGVTGGTEVWSASDTYNGYCPTEDAYPQTPIIIDTMNEGFQLTDADNGVVTDMLTGHPIRIAWTKAGSHNAFLWLDGHLFGNLTPQPPSDDPNGFRALAVYDNNHDGVIDAKDPVFPRLRLWIDANHDGIVQSEELFTLPRMGVYSISLDYVLNKYMDALGNLFRYRGHLQKETRGVDRTIYDVLLTTATHTTTPTIENTLPILGERSLRK